MPSTAAGKHGRLRHLQAAGDLAVSLGMTRIWCNGRWLEGDDFPASVTDRGTTLGLGLFETILAVDGRPIFVDRHLERLRSSCGRLGWNLEIHEPEAIMRELMHSNQLASGRCRIRLAITGGSGPVHDLSSGGDHVLWMMAIPLPEAPESGAVNISPWVRNDRSPLVGLKCASYAENIFALDHARQLGFEETLFLNTSGELCEAATANVFIVGNGSLATPPLQSGCLPGITRGMVIELADRLGIPCDERRVSRDELDAADEVFLTSSIRGLMGVSRLGERKLDQAPGPVTRRLHEAWDAAALGGASA